MSNVIETNSFYDNPAEQMGAITQIGEAFAKSGMFGCTKVEQGIVLAMACVSERLNPIELKKKYHLIDGQLSMRTDAMLGEFRARGGKIKWLSYDAKKAEAEFAIDGNAVVLSYTIEDAQQAQLGGWNGKQFKPGGGWAKSPDAMLRARLVSKAVRMLAPEAISGTYTPEEIEDFAPSTPSKPLFQQSKAAELVEVKAEVVESKETKPTILDKLYAAIGGEEEAARTTVYLQEIKWLKPDQDIRDLNNVQINRIISSGGKFNEARDKKLAEMHSEAMEGVK